MTTAPRTWAEVPAAVRAACEAARTKRADGVPGVSQLADLAGWRAGPLNAYYGGPRPVTTTLIGGALGALGGYGLGALADRVLPDRYFEPGALRRRGLILGGAAGALPGAYQALDNLRQTGELESFFSRWPAGIEKPAHELFEPAIPRDRFQNAVLADPYTPAYLKATTAGLVEAASQSRGGVDWVTPWDVARVALGAGSGLVSGVVAGKALALLAGLTPHAQDQLKRVGIWTGVLSNVVPQALGLR